MLRWCEPLKKPADIYTLSEKHIAQLMTAYVKEHPTPEYHVITLAVAAGLFAKDREAAAVDTMRKHVLSCFPNDPSAPRLSDPGVTSPRVITPYFAHFAFPPLIERGQMN